MKNLQDLFDLYIKHLLEYIDLNLTTY